MKTRVANLLEVDTLTTIDKIEIIQDILTEGNLSSSQSKVLREILKELLEVNKC